MILSVLKFIQACLNEFLINHYDLQDSKVVLNDIVAENGVILPANKNKLVLSLINIERETINPYNTRNQKLESGNYSQTSPIERYNLYLMVSSHFDDYSESIEFLNAAIVFFQAKPLFDPTSNSNMPQGIQKLVIELDAINYHEMMNLWNAMGAKYRPSVIYKMRLITLNPMETEGSVSAVKAISNNLDLK